MLVRVQVPPSAPYLVERRSAFGRAPFSFPGAVHVGRGSWEAPGCLRSAATFPCVCPLLRRLWRAWPLTLARRPEYIHKSGKLWAVIWLTRWGVVPIMLDLDLEVVDEATSRRSAKGPSVEWRC